MFPSNADVPRSMSGIGSCHLVGRCSVARYTDNDRPSVSLVASWGGDVGCPHAVADVGYPVLLGGEVQDHEHPEGGSACLVGDSLPEVAAQAFASGLPCSPLALDDDRKSWKTDLYVRPSTAAVGQLDADIFEISFQVVLEVFLNSVLQRELLPRLRGEEIGET